MLNAMPQTLPIIDIKKHSEYVWTFYLLHKLDIEPGQFLMIWVPGIDEKPFTVSYKDDKKFAVTVQKVGPFTKAMFKLSIGDKIGFRGPFGNGYSVENPAIMVGGGCGMAELTILYHKLKNPIVIYGARTKDLLVFRNMFKDAICTTDDGSFGFKGLCTEKLAVE